MVLVPEFVSGTGTYFRYKFFWYRFQYFYWYQIFPFMVQFFSSTNQNNGKFPGILRYRYQIPRKSPVSVPNFSGTDFRIPGTGMSHSDWGGHFFAVLCHIVHFCTVFSQNFQTHFTPLWSSYVMSASYHGFKTVQNNI